MITKEQAAQLRHGQIVYYGLYQNRDGSPARFRVSGRLKTWKTRPEEFRLPVTNGLRNYGALTHQNNADFYLTEEEARQG